MFPIFALISLALCSAPFSEAAVRSVSFNGMAISHATMLPVVNGNYYNTCNVTITNTGSTQQKLTPGSFHAIRWEDTGATFHSDIVGNADQITYSRLNTFYNIGPVGIDSRCSGNGLFGLPPGGSCIIRWVNETLPNTETWGVCAGRFSVQDGSDTAPGSVIASGSISILQEQQVLGGVLSGAHYLSGTPLNNFNGIQLAPTGAPPNLDANYQLGDLAVNHFIAGQMNIYCSSACGKTLGSFDNSVKSRCNEICGLSGTTFQGDGFVAPEDFPAFNATFGWMNSSGPVLFGNTPIPAHHPNSGADQPGNPSFSVNIASGNFAGGMVMEMIMGPLSSICSANTEYWQAGEVDFTFPSYIVASNAGVAVRGSSAYPGSPPQRLLCTQRHGRPDLFLKVGATSNFQINSGLPF